MPSRKEKYIQKKAVLSCEESAVFCFKFNLVSSLAESMYGAVWSVGTAVTQVVDLSALENVIQLDRRTCSTAMAL